MISSAFLPNCWIIAAPSLTEIHGHTTASALSAAGDIIAIPAIPKLECLLSRYLSPRCLLIIRKVSDVMFLAKGHPQRKQSNSLRHFATLSNIMFAAIRISQLDAVVSRPICLSAQASFASS